MPEALPGLRRRAAGADPAWTAADANAFVVPLDPERTWFRYHHLFGDLLRLELRRRMPEEVPGLHRRAAGWFLRHGQAAEAILSRPEIAGQLSVSVNTVSTHLRSIYAKLQVRDRSSAVQRARELRLPAAGPTR